MKKKIYTGLLVAGLVVGLSTSALAAQTGLYVGGNYYSTYYLSTLTVTQRAAIFRDTQATPSTSFAVVGSKYANYADYTGIESLKAGADSIVPTQVLDVYTGKTIDPVTGTEVTHELNVNSVSISGIAKVGAELTADVSSPAGATASYQWQICSTAVGVYADISGATTNKYSPVAGDETKFIKVVATGTGLYSATATSVATAAVAKVGIAPVNLGTAGNYVILAKSGISSVPNSVITGDIGVSPVDSTAITGFSLTNDATNQFSGSSQITGRAYASDYTSPTASNLTTAVSNMETAYVDAAGRAVDYTELHSGDISGKTLTAGVYKWGTGVSINSDVTLNGGINDVFIFQIAKGITQANGTKVILTGGVQAKNIFWQSEETVSIGTNAHFEGIVMGKTNITVGTNASINGRLLAQTAVTLDASTVVAP